MTEFIVLPGIGGSDENHWQTHWQQGQNAMRRFQPTSWDIPDFTDWVAALESAVAGARTPPILVAHSLSCLLVAHWQKLSALPAKGAFLVAVPDPSSPVFPQGAGDFAAVPESRFRFPSLIVASTNDPYGSLHYAQARGMQWGSRIHAIGALGHISSGSNLGKWPEGTALLAEFERACHQ